MRRSERRRQEVAAAPIADVVQHGILLMRTLAYRRVPLTGVFPGVDHQEQIRLIADVCDTLLPGLRTDVEYTPTEALQQTWDTRDDAQRQWLLTTMRDAGVDIAEFVTMERDGHDPHEA